MAIAIGLNLYIMFKDFSMENIDTNDPAIKNFWYIFLQ